MKKKQKQGSDTLLVLCTASFGGPTSSAINLLHLFREQGNTLDVFLMDHGGVRTKDIAEEGNLLPKIPMLADAITDKKNIKTLPQLIRRAFFVISHKLFGVPRARKWLYKSAARRLNGRYNNVIAFQESITSDFVRYIDTPNRISWMHTDFNRLCALSPHFATKAFYDSYRHVACVTRASADAMKERLARDDNSIHVIRNTLLPASICQRAKEPIPAEEGKKKPFLLVSVGRLSPEKGFDRIPRIAKRLTDAGFSFDWYIIGNGITRDIIEREIDRCGVSHAVRLLGTRQNPYPYIRLADCLVITSEYEAQPMVANEALILDTPVISTRFDSAFEVIQNDINGRIVPQDEQAVADAVADLFRDPALREAWTEGARAFRYDNSRELDRLRAILLP